MFLRRSATIHVSEYFFIGIGGNTNLPFKRGNDIIAFGLIDRRGSTPRQIPMTLTTTSPVIHGSQRNTNFDIGHTDNTQNVLNIQPVYPTHLSPNWNLITRPILPVISQPPFLSGPELHAAEQVFGPEIGETEFGLGDLTPESMGTQFALTCLRDFFVARPY